MIAPVKRRKASVTSPGIHRARQVLASMLLTERPRGAKDGSAIPATDALPPMPAWRAWLLTAWVIVVVAAYFASMAGWF
jgi:hypothetical protein